MPSVPAHSYYGKPQNDYRLAQTDGGRLAAPSGPYIGRGNKCTGNEDTCEGNRAKGTEYCMGHLRQMLKEQNDKNGIAPQEVTTDGSDEDESE